MNDRKLYRKIGIASAIMMASVLLSRVIGLFREMAIAYQGGAGADVDAYQVAFVIPDILNHIVAGGFLSVTFIPIFSKYLARDEKEEGWRVASVVFTCFGSLLVVCIAIASIFAPRLIALLAPGMDDPVLISKAVYMTRIILPAQFFFFAGGLFMAIQFAMERFAIPALAPLIYNAGIIAGGLLLARWEGVAGFSWGVLAGAFVGNFALQYWGAKKAGMKLRIDFGFKHPELRNYIFLTLPLMIGLTMTFSTELFLKFFGSFLREGSIAALNYALRITLMLVGFFGQAVGAASFPFLARLAAENRTDEMNRLLNDTMRYLSLVIPASVLVMVLRTEVVRILFERGRFDAYATQLTASALFFLLLGAFAFASQTIVVRGYYAMKNTLFPAIFGTLAVAASIPLFWVGMKFMGIDGVGLAISLSAILQVSLLYILWNKRTDNKGSLEVYAAYLKMILLSVPVGLFLNWAKDAVPTGALAGSLRGDLLICAVCGIVFFGIVAAAGYLFRIPEIRWFADEIAGRLRKK